MQRDINSTMLKIDFFYYDYDEHSTATRHSSAEIAQSMQSQCPDAQPCFVGT